MKVKDRLALLEKSLRDTKKTYYTLLGENNELKDLLENAQVENDKLLSAIDEVLKVIEQEDLTNKDVWSSVRDSLMKALSEDMDSLLSDK